MNEGSPSKSPFDELIGTEWLEIGDQIATARIAVRPELTQPHGLVHGGVYAALAESVCSRATATAVWPDGKIAMGQSNHTSLLRPVTEGQITAMATRKHRGRSTWIWEVELTDDQGRLCALVRMTLAVRPRPAGS